MNILINIIIALIIGYLLGSIPFGYIVGKLHGHDLTKIGSGSTGATNVLRNCGKLSALCVLLLDFSKGLGAPLLAMYLLSSSPQYISLYMVLAGLACLVGHIKSIWIGWKGGKAVASGVGIFFALNWIAGALIALTWILTVVISRVSSLGALVAISLSSAYMYYGCIVLNINTYNTVILIIYCCLATAYIIYKHKDNIKRLLNGTEPKIKK